jgi:signal transduction histidine kinase
MSVLDQTHRRLEQLYEISKLFARFENVEQTFYPALEIAMRTLPLRTAILMEARAGGSEMIVWPFDDQSLEDMRAAKQNVEKAYTYLVGATSTEATALPQTPTTEESHARRFIVIPLVVAHRPAFGALQVEGVGTLDKPDLIFVNAIANQLAIALDRDRAWQRDITRREHAEKERTEAEEGRTEAEEGRTDAEQGRTYAEARGATSERGRISAERSSEKYEALASENSELYKEAQRAVRVREQLLAIVSHDLRGPLGTILLTTEVLAASGEHQKAIGRIQRAAKGMLRLIEDLLDFASIEAGSLSIKRQPQDPGPVIQETLASFEGVAQAKGLELTAAVEPHLPKVFCDSERILQVLANLVGNAIKVTAKGGHITLRVEPGGHEVLFSVSDNGPGISEEDLKHLFERYWRSGKAEYKGTGLGLAIASGIVSAHGGRIWAESELARGATFRFTIPTADLTALFAAPVIEGA